MRILASLSVGVVAAGTALAIYSYRRHSSTGEGYLDILKQLPGDVQRWAADARGRAASALEDGRSAARARESQISGQLAATQPSSHAA